MKVSLERNCTTDTTMGVYLRPENTLDAFIIGEATKSDFNLTFKRNENEIEWVMIDPLKLIAWLGKAERMKK